MKQKILTTLGLGLISIGLFSFIQNENLNDLNLTEKRINNDIILGYGNKEFRYKNKSNFIIKDSVGNNHPVEFILEANEVKRIHTHEIEFHTKNFEMFLFKVKASRGKNNKTDFNLLTVHNDTLTPKAISSNIPFDTKNSIWDPILLETLQLVARYENLTNYPFKADLKFCFDAHKLSIKNFTKGYIPLHVNYTNGNCEIKNHVKTIK